MKAFSVLLLATVLSAGACGGPSEAELRAEKAHASAAAQSKAAAARQAAARARSRALVARCDVDTQHIRNKLDDVNARLNSGLNFGTYQTKVGDVESAFSRDLRTFSADAKANVVTTKCLTKVLTPLAGAVDLHASALKAWSGCIDSYSCDINKGPEADKMQKSWLRAGKLTDRGEGNLSSLRPAAGE